MNIKRNVIFSLESRKKNGVPVTTNVPIRMRVIYSGNRIDFSTGYRIDVSPHGMTTNSVSKTAAQTNLNKVHPKLTLTC